MTPLQEAAFRERGCVLLERALDRKWVAPIEAHVLDELKRLRIWSAGQYISRAIRKTPPFQQVTKLSAAIRRDDLEPTLIDRDMRSAIQALAGTKLVAAQSQLLISLPHQGDWRLRGLSWHTDVSAPSPHRVPGIQAFILIDDVQPRGGATLALAGSHRLGRENAGKVVRSVLQNSDDLERDLGNLGLSIIEMSGRAGDVYLMDMRVLHTPSINSTKRVRLMATIRYLAV